MNLNLKQYKTLDLAVFAVLIAVFETINILSAHWFPYELFTISLLIPLCAIVIMRWGAYGIIHSALSGLVYCIAMSEIGEVTLQNYVIYIVGNCFAGLVILMFFAVDKQKIAQNYLLTAIYVAVMFLCIEAGRTVVAMMFGFNVEVFVEFSTKDALSAVIGLVIVLIARKQNGLFEDQMHYLRRLEAEREQKRKLKDEGMQ